MPRAELPPVLTRGERSGRRTQLCERGNALNFRLKKKKKKVWKLIQALRLLVATARMLSKISARSDACSSEQRTDALAAFSSCPRDFGGEFYGERHSSGTPTHSPHSRGCAAPGSAPPGRAAAPRWLGTDGPTKLALVNLKLKINLTEIAAAPAASCHF